MSAHDVNQNRKKLLLTLSLTGAYMIAEVIGGILTGSLALLADAGHMLTDISGLGMSLVAIHLANRPADDRRSFGFMRAEILAAVANAVLLLGVSIYILFEAYERFRTPPEISGGPMLWVAVVGLLVNIGGIFLLKENSNSNLNMRGAYFEVLSDLLSSVGVIVAAVIIWLTGWTIVDPIVSAGIGLFIFPRTWLLLKDAIHVLLEGSPSDVDVPKLRAKLVSIAGVSSIHDLHVWTISSGQNSMTAHIVAKKNEDLQKLRASIENVLRHEFGITHSTIQLEMTPETHLTSHN